MKILGQPPNDSLGGDGDPPAEPPSHSGSHPLWVCKFISGKNWQNAVKSMVVTDGEGRVL
ncbi:hypothetical protein GCM10010330_78130 [Streptomyces tendae]|nr:hypothetical protein GCM10010330_78130 [Streptomyces tendae]